MILRILASVAIVGLLVLNAILPTAAMTARGTDTEARADVESHLAIGEKLPAFELVDFDGRKVTQEDLQGHRVLITFERSVDW